MTAPTGIDHVETSSLSDGISNSFRVDFTAAIGPLTVEVPGEASVLDEPQELAFTSVVLRVGGAWTMSQMDAR